MAKASRIGSVCGATLLALLAGLLPAANADTVTHTDPKGDVSVAKKDIIAARASFGPRVKVITSFVRVRHGTSYFVSISPGRRFRGDRFIASARVRRNGTTAGFLAHAPRQNTPYQKVRCAGLRTVANFDKDRLRVAVPTRCLRRYGPLGGRAWLRLESAPFTGVSQDYLPEPPKAFRVRRH